MATEMSTAFATLAQGKCWLAGGVQDRNKNIFKGNVYYLLKGVGERFVTFSFNLYRWDRADIRKAIDEIFSHAEYRRMYVKESRYSEDSWRCRNPVMSEEELRDDFIRLSAIVEPILRNCEMKGMESQGLVDVTDVTWSKLSLPTELQWRVVTKWIRSGKIDLPTVQRGKVWNAARCATLWDSVLRGFAIGSLSVQCEDDKYYLLDGQQRTVAMLLGDAEYPPKDGDNQGVLWIDLNPNFSDECKFHFYVTTASQPWGYERTTDETKNGRLPFAEVRETLNGVEWHKKDEKPYPCELWPKRASFPVPFSLLLDYISKSTDAELKEGLRACSFVEWCTGLKRQRSDVSCHCWNWLEHDKNYEGLVSLNISEDLCRAVRGLENYKLLVQNAGQVSDDDVSLYFTRIGKGGVVPSNEELAYSVLKVELGKSGVDFREGIDAVSEKLGLDRPCRIAAMAVRYCISMCDPDCRSKANFVGLYTGDVLSKVIDDKHAQKPWIEKLQHFVRKNSNDEQPCSELMTLCKKINDELLGAGYTNWHISRYCQRHSGTVYQFLMMLSSLPEEKRKKWNDLGLTLGGVAELLCWYAPDPAYVIRKIIAFESFAEGFASALRETHYGAPRMNLPISYNRIKERIDSILNNGDDEIMAAFEDAIKQSEELANLISTGYGDELSYSRLIFACNQNSKGNKLFEFNSLLDVWRDDACPWDYDHILPHSWVDRLKKTERERYSWLVNSIGNLAPIDFSTNRSLSDSPRDQYYPLREGAAQKDIQTKQSECCIEKCDADLIAQMGTFPDQKTGSVAAFYRMTLSRFSRMYQSWSRSLVSSATLDVRSLFRIDKETPLGIRRDAICALVERIKASLPSRVSVVYEDSGGIRQTFDGLPKDDFSWYVWQSIGLSCASKDNSSAVELWIDRDCTCELGIWKEKDGYQKLNAQLPMIEVVEDAIEEISSKLTEHLIL